VIAWRAASYSFIPLVLAHLEQQWLYDCGLDMFTRTWPQTYGGADAVDWRNNGNRPASGIADSNPELDAVVCPSDGAFSRARRFGTVGRWSVTSYC
jgi:hypothetical protein